MDLDVNFEDFDKMCRICLQFAKALVPISINNIVNMIKACASVNIWINDELPNQICQSCLARLQDSFNFKHLCEKSDNDLRQVIAAYKTYKQNVLKECDEIEFPLKMELEIDDKAKDGSVDTISLKNEEVSADDENTEDNNDDTFSLKNEDVHSDSEIKNENIDVNSQNNKVSLSKIEKAKKSGNNVKRTHKKVSRKYKHKCNVCDYSTKDSTSLKRHMLKHTGDKPFKCDVCEKKYRSTHSLKKHICKGKDRSKNSACHICGKTVTKKRLKQHVATHGERKTVDCPVCQKQFYHKSSLTYHIQRVHENVPKVLKHLCNVCGNGFRRLWELKKHMLVHTDEKSFKCDKCTKRYRNKYALKIHVSRAHLDERNYFCTICSRGFYDRRILENHIRTHTGERPFKCLLCDKAFGAKIAMRIHMKQVHRLHSEKKEKPIILI